MRPITAPQGKARAQVSLQIRHLADISHQHLIHSLLVRNLLRINLLLLGSLAVLEEVIFSLSLAILFAGPVLVLGNLVEDRAVDTSDIYDGRSGDDVSVVDAAEGDAIGLEGTGDKENAFGEVAQEHDALAAEATGEEDEDGAGLEGLAVLGRVDGLAGLVEEESEYIKLKY